MPSFASAATKLLKSTDSIQMYPLQLSPKRTMQLAKVIQTLNYLALCVALLLAATLCSPADAEIKLNLRDSFLQTQCDWAMYLDVQDIQGYLNYDKSKLHPLSRVRISYRAFPKPERVQVQDSDSKPYEMLWYFKRTPIGQDRRSQITFEPETLGMIVLGPAGTNSDHCSALTNALLRLLVDLQFKSARTSIVLVKDADFDQVANALNYYHFSEGMRVKSGSQMNIHLCSSSSAKEKYFFLDK